MVQAIWAATAEDHWHLAEAIWTSISSHIHVPLVLLPSACQERAHKAMSAKRKRRNKDPIECSAAGAASQGHCAVNHTTAWRLA